MSISHQLRDQTNCLYGSPADGRAGLLVNDAPLGLSRKNGPEATIGELLFAELAAAEKSDQLARDVNYAYGADAVLFQQVVDALDGRMLGNEQLRVDRAHYFPGPQSAPLLAWNLFQILERKNANQAVIMGDRKSHVTMKRQD